MPSTPEKFTMPNGDVIWFRSSDHAYFKTYNPATNSCSGRVSGISTLSKNSGDTNTDGLIDWGSKLTCEGVSREVAETLARPSPLGVGLQWAGSGDSIWNHLRELKLTWRDIRDEAGTRGTVSHDVLQQLAEGKSPIATNRYDDAVIDWWNVRKPEPIYVEKVVYDRENNIAGRFDLMYGPNCRTSQPILTDLKTSKYLSNSFAIQLNLYRLACEGAGLMLPDKLSILQVFEDGSWQEVPVPINPDWAYNAMAIAGTGKEIRSILAAAKKSARKGQAKVEA